jgi:hypothetical protein
MKNDYSIRRFVLAFLAISIIFLIDACGGGGSDSDTNPAATGTITGSVSGTTVIAVDDDGEIVASDDTRGDPPDTDLDGDGNAESFSFILSAIPVGVDIRIFLVTDDGVFPMYFDDNGTDVNVFSLSSGTDISLGHVATVGQGDNATAVPQRNPLDNPVVNAKGVESLSATISDFVGTWEGGIPYVMEDGESGIKNTELTLNASGSTLVGTITYTDEGSTLDITGIVIGGIFTFDLPTDEPGNPDCANWDVSFQTLLDTSSTIMSIVGSGTFCGEGGGKSGDFFGFLTRF